MNKHLYRSIIEREPLSFPADEPVRRDTCGRWEPGNPDCPICKQSKFKDLDADIWADWTPPFCPNCGARMYSTTNSEVK